MPGAPTPTRLLLREYTLHREQALRSGRRDDVRYYNAIIQELLHLILDPVQPHALPSSPARPPPPWPPLPPHPQLRHVPVAERRRTLCSLWAEGRCPYVDCPFEHGSEA
tara:strand:+ start:914 stop:1240 length:327 start_codon:yes stop_codon:yes gene_type:complete